ncbi:MAG: phenylalanine--tRNA ligase subunit beta [Patescibacteria group bacterium]
MKVQLSWLQDHIEEKLPDPKELSRTLSLRAFEIEGVKGEGDEAVIDVDVLPNRNHDCLSHRGVAREIAAIYGFTFKEGEKSEIKKEDIDVKVDIKEKELCRRYVAVPVLNIKVEPSPKWLKDRLEALGERSINNIVDITNFIMFDTGQPLHAFDKDKLDGEKIIVRKAKPGEAFITLDGSEMELNGTELVIADEVSVIALAGVKGGKKAEVDDSTRNIVLESASFDPVSVRRTSRSLDLITESSKRFENNASRELSLESAERALSMIKEIAGLKDTSVGQPVDVYPKPIHPWSVSVPLSEIKSILGIEISKERAKGILEGLKCKVSLKDKVLEVEPPIDRIDLTIPEEIVEEVGRIYGYEYLDSALLEPLSENVPINKHFYYKAKISSFLQSYGFSEMFTYTIRDKGKVELANPLTYDRKFLRDEIGSDMKKALDLNERNIELIGDDRVKIFEIANVFNPEAEKTHLSLGVRNVKKKQKPKQDEFIKEVLKGLSSELGKEMEEQGSFVSDGVWECTLDDLIESLPQPRSWDIRIEKTETCYKPISPYPFVLRDIAVFVPSDVGSTDVLKVIEDNAGELLVNHRLFDVYEKTDEKGNSRISYAFRLVFLSQDKTLSDNEVNKVMDIITDALNSKKGWQVR